MITTAKFNTYVDRHQSRIIFVVNGMGQDGETKQDSPVGRWRRTFYQLSLGNCLGRPVAEKVVGTRVEFVDWITGLADQDGIDRLKFSDTRFSTFVIEKCMHNLKLLGDIITAIFFFTCHGQSYFLKFSQHAIGCGISISLIQLNVTIVRTNAFQPTLAK